MKKESNKLTIEINYSRRNIWLLTWKKSDFSWYPDCIFFVEAALSLILGIFGLVKLLKSKKKKPSNMMLAHLTMCNMLCVIVYIGVVTLTIVGITFENQRSEWVLTAIFFALYIPNVMSLVIITLDRILAINLVLRYRLVVTNKRLFAVLVCVWILSAVYGVSCWFLKSDTYLIVLFIFSLVVVIFFVCSYIYIIVKVKVARKELATSGQRNRQSRLNYWVPFTIILTYFLFVVATDLSVVYLNNITIWHIIVWSLNTIADTLTYVIGSARIGLWITCRKCKKFAGEGSGCDSQISVKQISQSN